MKATKNAPAKKAAAKKAPAAKVDVYQMITDRFIAKMEAGNIPWQKPWQSYGPARNFASGHVYTGINALLLPFLCDGIPLFVTYLQAKELGGNIRAGAKGLPVVYYNIIEKKGGAEDKKEVVPFIRYTTVFSVSDVENVELNLPQLEQRTNEPIEAAQAVVNQWADCPRIEHKEQAAFYVPALDYVNMPARNSFSSPEAYHCVLFHELTHATGHRDRLNRADLADNMAVKGSAGYAREELTAELGAAFLCHQTGLNPAITEDNTTAYLQHWIGQLKNDKKLLVQAAGHAAKAANLILGIQAEQPAPLE